MEACRGARRFWLKRIAALGLLAGVAGRHALASYDAQALRERVSGYWRARSESDLAAAYEFYAPAFRKQYTRGQFLSQFQRLLRFPPSRFRIEETKMMADGMTARVRVHLVVKQEFVDKELEVESFAEEDWVLDDGTWWKRNEVFVPNV